MSRTTLTVVAALLAAAALGAQSGPVELPARQNPDLREIGAFYFENPSESQIWINLEPTSNEADVAIHVPRTLLA